MRTVLAGAQPADVLPEVPDLVGIEARGRLVHDEHVGVMQQRLRHPDPLAEAPGELSDGLLHHLVERAEGGHFPDAGGQPAGRDLAGFPEEAEQFRRGHVRIERAVLGQVAEPAGRVEALRVDIQPGDLGGAPAGREIAGQHLHRGGLPGAVRPQEGDDLPPGNREAHALDGHERPIELAEIARLDHDRLGHIEVPLLLQGEKARNSSHRPNPRAQRFRRTRKCRSGSRDSGAARRGFRPSLTPRPPLPRRSWPPAAGGSATVRRRSAD